MSPKVKRLSGAEVIAIFKLFGFEVHSQKGSHVKIRRLFQGAKQSLVPLHSELDSGTVRAIFRQATRYIQGIELHHHFFID